MSEPEKQDDTPDTADMYHFRSRANLILFCVFIVALLAVLTFWLLRGTAKV